MRVFDSVDQLLSPAGLAEVVGGVVQSAERASLAAEHYSGNALERVRVRSEAGEAHFVLKQFSIKCDWVMRLTHDTRVREVALYRSGAYARMPEEVIVPVVAAARDGESWASLMLDVSDSLALPGDRPVSLTDATRYLDRLAAVHARFMNDTSLLDPALGLSSLEDFVQILSPQIARREIDAGRAHPVLEWAVRGWEALETAAPAALQVVKSVQADPTQLLNQLANMPRTLLHGDYKLANLGALPDGRTVILDWQDAACGPPLLDLGYFLAINAARLPMSKKMAVQLYRDSLAARGHVFGDDEWARMLDLCLFGGGALRLIWQKALAADSDLEWWDERAERARRWLM